MGRMLYRAWLELKYGTARVILRARMIALWIRFTIEGRPSPLALAHRAAMAEHAAFMVKECDDLLEMADKMLEKSPGDAVLTGMRERVAKARESWKRLS